MMHLTSLTIEPRNRYRTNDEQNPMVCTVKLASEKATVETVLSDEQVLQVLRLVQGIVADAAKRNVDDFVAQAQMVQGMTANQIEGESA